MWDIVHTGRYIQLLAVILSAVYLGARWFYSCLNGHHVYSPIVPVIDPDEGPCHKLNGYTRDTTDEWCTTNKQAHLSVQSSNRLDNYTIRRILDASDLIRNRMKKQNAIAYLLKFIGSCIVWSAEGCIIWRSRYYSQPKTSYRIGQLFLIEFISWTYITLLAAATAWSRGNSTKQYISRHQMYLIIIGYFSFVLNIVDIHYLHHKHYYYATPIMLIIATVGVHITMLGALLSRKTVESAANGRVESLEVSASPFEWLTFGWLTPLMEAGFCRALKASDLWELPKNLQAEEATRSYKSKKKLSMFASLIAVNRQDIFYQMVYAIAWSIKITQNLVLIPSLYALGLFLGMLGTNFCLQHGNFIGQHLLIRSKAIISHQIIEKSLRLQLINEAALRNDKSYIHTNGTSKNQHQYSTTGWSVDMVNNLLSVDARNVSEAFGCLHLFVGSLLQIIIAIIFLWQLIDVSTLAGLATMLFFFGISNFVTKTTTHVFERLLSTTENCLTIIVETLYSIRVIKYLAWEAHICARIIRARTRELKHLWRRHILYTLLTMALDGGPLLVTCVALGMHTIVFSRPLTAQIAFTVLSVFELLRVAVLQLPFVLFWQIQSQASYYNINSYLNLPESPIKNDSTADSDEPIGFIHADFTWEPQHQSFIPNRGRQRPQRVSNFLLSNLNFHFRIGDFNVITGSAASGKSSMLLALLGEMPRIKGRVFLPNYQSTLRGDNSIGTTVAYVAQQTWLQDTTIRENILFGQAYDEIRYQQTLRASYCFARAIYGPAHHILLDECFTEIDDETTEYIVDKCLFGPLMYGRTRILATRRVIGTGNLAALLDIHSSATASSTIPNTSRNLPSRKFVRKLEPIAEVMRIRSNSTIMDHASLTGRHPRPLDVAEDTNNMETSSNHYVGYRPTSVLSLLRKFLSSGGSPLWWCFVFAAFIFYQLVSFLQSYWLRIWAGKHVSASQQLFYFGNYAALSLSAVALIGLPPLLIYFSSIRSSQQTYMQLVDYILKTAAHSLNTLPIANIIHRFGKNMLVVDQELPADLAFFLYSIMGILAHLIVICAVLPRFTMIAGLAVILCIYLACYFIKTLHSFKQLEPETKFAFFTFSSDIFSGLPTIRASGMQNWFLTESIARIDDVHRQFYFLTASAQWITCRIEWIAAVCTLIVTFMLLLSGTKADPSLFGFILTYVIGLATSAGLTIQYCTKVDNAMQSLKSVTDPMYLEQEWADITLETIIPSPEWPEHGSIEFQNLSTNDTNYRRVLSKIWVSIQPGERIGIIGESGAGKSAIAMALFRFMEIAEGRILIDNIDISRVPLEDLRSRLSIIPRDPVLFSGTIRSNLDPYWHHDDATIWNALRRCRLIGSDAGAIRPEGLEHLDAPVTHNGENLSYQQRKLLTVARALLREDKILIIEESADLDDSDTEAKLQAIVREEFIQVTRLYISSSVNNVLGYDRVMVLDTGCLMEFDAPATLIRQTNSILRNLCQQAGELDTLMAMATASVDEADVASNNGNNM
ncbi:hypothetical protein BDF19DRAFT_435493 [Syncephalis fuscata]|nr:hypothetical protein BDF19DRAFT_435493 [Syncephalis fuscata]